MINPAELELLQQALATLSRGFEKLPAYTPDFDKGAAASEYLRRASEKLYLVAKEKLAIELSMEEVLYDPAPEKDEE